MSARAASIPPSARPSAEHVRALEAAGLLEVRLLKKFAQRPLMSVWKGEDNTQKAVLLTVVDACGTPAERDRVIGAARALLPLAGTQGVQNVYRVMEDVDAFVTDFLGAGTASDLVVLRWPMTRRLDFVCRIADALVELHAADVVHGCLCPDNILLDDDLHPVLTEVGMVSVRGSLEGDPENFFGYGAYAAPEMILGKPDPRADVYSLGRLLSFVVLDRTPGSGGGDDLDLKELHAKSPTVATIVRKCVAPLDGRYASMTELAADLKRCRQLLVPESSSVLRPAPPPAVHAQTTAQATRAPSASPTRPAGSAAKPEPTETTSRTRPGAEAPKSASPAWVPIGSLVLLACALGVVLTLPIKSGAIHLVLQAVVGLAAVGLTMGLRVTQGVRVVLGILAFGVAMAAKPTERLSKLDDPDALTRAAAARQYVLGGAKDLRANKLQLADFSNLDLTGADLDGADLTQANLTKAKLGGAHVEGASFLGADLSGADVGNVALDSAFAIDTATCDNATVLPVGFYCNPSHKVRRGTPR